MTKTKPAAWHSKNSEVYHASAGCQTGDNIAARNRIEGDGGLRLCDECARLMAPEPTAAEMAVFRTEAEVASGAPPALRPPDQGGPPYADPAAHHLDMRLQTTFTHADQAPVEEPPPVQTPNPISDPSQMEKSDSK